VGAAGVGKESEMPNAAEATRQHMKQEATNELVSVERHHLGFVVGTIILPAEANAAVLAGEESTSRPSKCVAKEWRRL
jgi:hypothetical protein